MKISESWLREWLNPPLNGEQLAAQLTMAGIGVESRHPVAGEFDHVIVARVLKTTPHPQADKLSICVVDTGKGNPIQVVCGAANVRAGLSVALALPGATLPGDVRIKESMLRGEPSNGMLCSSTELGLDDESEGIIELPEDAIPGTDFREYYVLNDNVFDLELTPNRADCLSVLGVVRELAALNQLPLLSLPVANLAIDTEQKIGVHIDAPDACRHYFGRVIRQINSAAVTPLWIKERLRRSGLRSLHPVVDVMNYVMLELGQPLHAFDLQCISGEIRVRYAHPNEELLLLNGQVLPLSREALVIADSNQALSLAGIMGGSRSSVQNTTRDIFIESAFFEPLSIGPVARRHNISSDSSLRFERGVDPELQQMALDRATALLLEVVGGMAGPVTAVNRSHESMVKQQILFKPWKVKQLSGLDINPDSMRASFESLGMSVFIEGDAWLIDVPSYRFDLNYDVDLVEEIVRLYGYDKIPSQPTMALLKPATISSNDLIAERIALFFSDRGYSETISYSFVDPQLHQALYPQATVMQLLNPISSELSQMRSGLWPGLIASMLYNVHRQQVGIRFFELGTVFDLSGEVLHERACVAGLITGEFGHLNWTEPTRLVDFFDVKGDIEALCRQLQITGLRFIRANHDALHPGQSAQILIHNQPVGWIGALHPRFIDEIDLTNDVILFELSLAALLPQSPVCYRRISKYPQVRRDLSFIIDNETSAAEIKETVHDVVDKVIIKSFDVFDVYHGKEIPPGKKSLAIALTFQDDNRTLVDEDVVCVINAIIKALTLKFNIILRE